MRISREIFLNQVLFDVFVHDLNKLCKTVDNMDR